MSANGDRFRIQADSGKNIEVHNLSYNEDLWLDITRCLMKLGAFPTQIDKSSDISLLSGGQYSYYINTGVTQESVVYYDNSSQSYAYFTLTGPEEYQVQFSCNLIT